MNYDQAIEYLSGLRAFGIKLGLERFAELCRRTGSPQDSLKVIHVGGTNGKGSTCTFITSILHAAGFSTGTYLSPYVYDVRERIQINGEMIPKDDFAELMTEIKPHIEAVAQTELGNGTEFEAKTLMAFLYFAKKKLDYSVIEVGMGGRYDATNLVTPLVSVITNVTLDHTERLGNTVQQIAWDKSGIAKPGAPLVTAASDEAWQTIYATAREQGVEQIWRVMKKGTMSPPDLPQPDKTVYYDNQDGKVVIDLPDGQIGPVELRLAGDFQAVNAAVSAAAVSALPNPVSHAAIEKGLTEAYLPGRLEVLRRKPTVVIDAAHNPDGAKKLAESVPKYFKYRKLILVIGMLSTHSAEEVLKILAPIADEVIATKSQWDKARPAVEVASAALKTTPNVRIVEPVPAAVQAALDSASEDDLVLVTGSFYTIGEVDREMFRE
ncbi:MAG: folylpolyglutamate synthase/dihydrofolate synthase family protein [Armatimonadota bacterium]